MSHAPIPDVREGEILHDCWHCGFEFSTRKTSGGLCGECWPKWLHGEFYLGITRETYEVQCLKQTVAHLMDGPELAMSESDLSAEEQALLSAVSGAVNTVENAQGDWLGVSYLHAPEWTHPLKEAADALNAALAKFEFPRVLTEIEAAHLENGHPQDAAEGEGDDTQH